MRVLVMMEAYSVTGPAKNLIEFAHSARSSPGGMAADLSIVTFQRGRPSSPNAFISALREAKLPVDVIDERFRFDPLVIPALRAIVDRRKPQILQTHNVKSHLLVRLTGLWRRYPWVAFHHGYTATNLKDRLYNQFDRWSLPAAHQFVTVCGPFADMLAGLGLPRERIAILHNTVKPFSAPSPAELAAVRDAMGVPEQAKLLVSVGRLSHEKGHAVLIDSISLLARRRPDLSFRLILVGDGPERPALLRQCKTLQVADKVILAGYRSDVRLFYAMATAVALPSLSEGSPNVLLESMAAGAPVAATAVGGVPEIATNLETALLTPKGDAPSMSGALERLLTEPALGARLAAAAKRMVETNFTPEAYRDHLLRIYDQVLGSFGKGELCASR